MADDLRHSYDVVVIGGGVVGCSIAYHLLGPMGFDGSVLVVERDPGYGAGSTGRSVGGVRQQFSTPENVAMSLYGADFVRAAAETLAVDGDAPDPAFRENGYLFLASEAALPVLDENHALQTGLGADIAKLDRDGLAARFPWLALDGVAGAGFGQSGEGWLDPYALLQGLRRKARSLGATFVADEAVGLERGADGRIAAVATAAHGRIACGHAVNAAGAAAGRVAAMAGIDLPVEPRKRVVFVFDCKDPPADCPLTVDPTGVYFRPEGPHFLCGKSPDPAQDGACRDFDIDYTPFEETIWPVLAERVPAFEAIKLVNAWAGHYEVNTLDANAVIGPHPEIDNLLFANGFSGHDLQQAPAAGRAIAELICHGAFRALDLARFGYERIAANDPIRERNVV